MTSTAKRGILYGVLALCLMGFCYVQGRADQRDQEALQQAQTLLAGHHHYITKLDSLADEAAGDSAYADSLYAHPRTVAIVTAHHDTVYAVDTVWVAQTVTALNHAYSACSEALNLCKARGDSLEASLAAVLKTKECHIWFVSCPSREVIFVGGGILGFLAAKH